MRIYLAFGLSAVMSPLFAKEKALLVSPDSLQEAWQDYAKAREDVAIQVVSLSEIKAMEGEGDLPEKIRLRVRQAIEKDGVTSIILGGDSDPQGGLVPDRDTFHQNMWGNDEDIPTDIFYLSKGDWDADGDGVYGEWEEDREAIDYPDGTIGIGRIPVRTVAEVKNYHEKVLRYLKQQAGDLVMTCAVRGAYAKVAKGGVEMIQPIWDEGEVRFLFNDLTSWDEEGKEGEFDLVPENILQVMNGGEVTKWHFHGHGLLDRWQLENNQDLTIESLSQLKNQDHLPVITTVSCFTGHFDAKEDPSITEALLRQKSTGAVAIVAPAREGKPHFHDPENDFPLMVQEGKQDGTTETMTYFWIHGIRDKADTGKALALTKKKIGAEALKSATYHQCVCELNLLGDPTLPIK